MADDFLRDNSRCGLFHLTAEQRTGIAGRAAAADLRFWEADLVSCRTSAECLPLLGKALAFPDWYGANFDALLDCLTDPDWQTGPGDILLISGLDRLRRSDRKGLSTLLEVLSTAVDERRSAGQPLWIFFDRPLPGIPALARL